MPRLRDRVAAHAYVVFVPSKYCVRLHDRAIERAMGVTENKYFDDSCCELVRLEDGVPTRYCSLARRARADEPAIAARVEALTGHAVRFGEWEQREPVGRDFESASEVALFVVPR